MTRIIRCLFNFSILLLIASNVYAYDRAMKFPTGTPITVATPSDLSSAGVPEAPNDTHYYGRKALGWSSLDSVYQPLATILTTLSNLANASGVLTNDGAGNISWGAGGSGANTALSNLASTQINTDLIFQDSYSEQFQSPLTIRVQVDAQVRTDTPGNDLALIAGDGNGDATGGGIQVTAGTGYAGGQTTITGGTGSTGRGGDVVVQGGPGTPGGNVYIASYG